jgi:hypothetical protein
MSASNKLITTEYEVRELDQYGDAIDVSHFRSRATAMDFAKRLQCVACIVEKHVKRYPAHLFRLPDSYATLATFGDKVALTEGGWIE